MFAFSAKFVCSYAMSHVLRAYRTPNMNDNRIQGLKNLMNFANTKDDEDCSKQTEASLLSKAIQKVNKKN